MPKFGKEFSEMLFIGLNTVLSILLCGLPTLCSQCFLKGELFETSGNVFEFHNILTFH